MRSGMIGVGRGMFEHDESAKDDGGWNWCVI